MVALNHLHCLYINCEVLFLLSFDSIWQREYLDIYTCTLYIVRTGHLVVGMFPKFLFVLKWTLFKCDKKLLQGDYKPNQSLQNSENMWFNIGLFRLKSSFCCRRSPGKHPRQWLVLCVQYMDISTHYSTFWDWLCLLSYPFLLFCWAVIS